MFGIDLSADEVAALGPVLGALALQQVGRVEPEQVDMLARCAATGR